VPDFSFKMHQIQFRLGLRLRPCRLHGSLQRFPDLDLGKREGKRWRERKEERRGGEREGAGGKGREWEKEKSRGKEREEEGKGMGKFFAPSFFPACAADKPFLS